MRYATIDKDTVDIDVCYGDYDGFITKNVWVVELFDAPNNLADRHIFKEENYSDAVKAAENFVDNGLELVEYA